MRILNYKLADGTIVKTYQEAIESKQRFTDYMVEEPRKRPTLSPKRKWLLDMFGVVRH